MQKKFYTAKIDAMFKAIFCNPKNTNLLKGLIEKCLKEKIEVIEIKSPEVVKKNIYEKGKVLDVLVYAGGRYINIEINSSYYNGVHRKNSAYIFNKYAEALKVGEDYLKMPEFIQIEFTNELPKNYPVLGKYEYIDEKTKIKRVDNLVTYEYNISKIKEESKKGNRLYDFVAALDFNLEEIKKYCGDDEYMKKFSEELKRLNDDIEFTEFLSAEEEARKTQNTLINAAKSEGLELGIIQGKKLGIDEGKKIGISQGKIEVAKNLLDLQMKISDIVKATGLSEKEINALNTEK